MVPRHGSPPQDEKYEESARQDSPEVPRRHRLALESSTSPESEELLAYQTRSSDLAFDSRLQTQVRPSAFDDQPSPSHNSNTDGQAEYRAARPSAFGFEDQTGRYWSQSADESSRGRANRISASSEGNAAQNKGVMGKSALRSGKVNFNKFARQVSIASSVGTAGKAESESGSLPNPPSQTEDLYYGDDQLDHHREIDEWEHKDQTAKERDPDRPNPCTLSGWELLFEFGVIEPTWRYKVRWDLLMVVFLFFTALVTPFEVAFLPKGRWQDPLSLINRLVDLGFFLDMVLNFFLSYKSDDGHKMVYDHHVIRKRYLHGWFILDFISMLPVDLLSYIDWISPSHQKGMRIMRLIKLLRLGRTWRLVKPGGILHTQRVDYNTLNLMMFFILIMFFSHWMACGWRLIPKFEDMEDNWTNNHPLHQYEGQYFVDNADGVIKMYVASLYWSIMTITTIGYGDVVPVTMMERWFDVVAMLLGGLIFGYIIGAIGNLVQQTSAKENEYHMAMNELDFFMNEMKLPLVMRTEISNYFQRLHTSLDVNTYHYYTDLLSPALKAKLLLYMNKTWITRVPHFQGAPQDFIVQVAVILTRHLFPPRELIIRSSTMPREVFIVNKGIAAGNNQLFTVGQLIGSDALVQTYKARTYSARAITYIECSRLDREQLFQVLESWPDMRKRFRLLAIKSIFREEIKAYCVAVRALRTRDQMKLQDAEDPCDNVRALASLAGAVPIAMGVMHGGGDQGGHSVMTKMDLFNKSTRTEFYTQKLEMINPSSQKDRARLVLSVLRVQRYFRLWKQKRDANAKVLVDKLHTQTLFVHGGGERKSFVSKRHSDLVGTENAGVKHPQTSGRSSGSLAPHSLDGVGGIVREEVMGLQMELNQVLLSQAHMLDYMQRQDKQYSALSGEIRRVKAVLRDHEPNHRIQA